MKRGQARNPGQKSGHLLAQLPLLLTFESLSALNIFFSLVISVNWLSRENSFNPGIFSHGKKKKKSIFLWGKIKDIYYSEEKLTVLKTARNLNSSIMSNYVKRKAISPMSSKTQIHFSTPKSSAVKEAKHYMQTSRKRNWLYHFKKRFQTKSFNNWKKNWR